MESVRIIEMQNDDSILALYNPDDMAERGLTSSYMTEHIGTNMNIPALMQFIVNFTHEHLEAEIHDEYNDYIPVALSILNLPNDRVLPAMLLMKQESDFMTQYMQMHQYGPQPIDEEAKQHITEYVNEFLHEKEDNIQEQANAKTEKNHTKSRTSEYTDQYLFRFSSLDTAISACGFVPFKKCTESHLIKHDKMYYILFSCNSEDSDNISGNVMQLLEFGHEENNITPGFLQEHGTLITSQLEKIIQAGLTQ